MGFFKKKAADNTIELRVTGMTCPHCEMRVSNSLKRVKGVQDAKADHTKDSAVVSGDMDISMDALKAAVEEAGYTYGG
jgi:Cu2+-exporting ATPase